jgi:hypothetical protein
MEPLQKTQEFKSHEYQGFPFTVEDIAKVCCVPADKICNIFLHGSRVYGCAKPDSGNSNYFHLFGDYDLLVVVDSELMLDQSKEFQILRKFKLLPDFSIPEILIDSRELFDLTLIHSKYWESKLQVPTYFS